MGCVHYRVAVQVSGGEASYAAAKLTLEEFGHDETAFVFADTKTEDEDLYRFLGDMEKRLNHPIIRVAEGRDIWQVFDDEGMIGNTRVDLCSRILKREVLKGWVDANCADDATIIIGFDANEAHRLPGVQARYAPRPVRSPLIERGIFKEQCRQIVKADGLEPGRLYAMGFPHNNCGGFCIKAGQASFALLLDFLPDRYAYHEGNEQAFRERTGKDVSIMRDRAGGETQPLTMREFRKRRQRQPSLIDWFDYGGCGCMEEPTEPPIATEEGKGE